MEIEVDMFNNKIQHLYYVLRLVPECRNGDYLIQNLYLDIPSFCLYMKNIDHDHHRQYKYTKQR